MMDGKAVRQKLIGSDDQRAVSPVIGVILMVAITVILAAVIAAFVLDMGQNQSQPAQAGVDIDESGGSPYTVTVTSMGDNTQTVKCVGSNGSSDGNSVSSVGNSFQCHSGNSVVAVNDQNEENTIQTNL